MQNNPYRRIVGIINGIKPVKTDGTGCYMEQVSSPKQRTDKKQKIGQRATYNKNLNNRLLIFDSHISNVAY